MKEKTRTKWQNEQKSDELDDGDKIDKKRTKDKKMMRGRRWI